MSDLLSANFFCICVSGASLLRESALGLICLFEGGGSKRCLSSNFIP